MLANSFLKTTPTLQSESQLDESEDYDGSNLSDSGSDCGGGVTYPNLLSPECAVIILRRFSLMYERLQRYAPPFTEIQAISIVPHFFFIMQCADRA